MTNLEKALLLRVGLEDKSAAVRIAALERLCRELFPDSDLEHTDGTREQVLAELNCE